MFELSFEGNTANVAQDKQYREGSSKRQQAARLQAILWQEWRRGFEIRVESQIWVKSSGSWRESGFFSVIREMIKVF